VWLVERGCEVEWSGVFASALLLLRLLLLLCSFPFWLIPPFLPKCRIALTYGAIPLCAIIASVGRLLSEWICPIFQHTALPRVLSFNFFVFSVRN
jgi:hypothetical protein